MVFGEQQPMIRIPVDQRLALDSAVYGEVEDTSVATEITQFDKVSDSYILEGALTFSGNIQNSARDGGEPDSEQKAPFEYRLPFALRLPVEGQPDFLRVNTRIRDWKLQLAQPDSLQFQAELTVFGLDARSGYYFYCGDQEDWVQPAQETVAVADRSEEEDLLKANSETLEEILEEELQEELVESAEPIDVEQQAEFEQESEIVEGNPEVYTQAADSYNEQDWMIEIPEETDNQDTLIFEPGWQQEVQSALITSFAREEEDEARTVENQEDEFQFEAMADEALSDSAASKAEAYENTTADQVESLTQEFLVEDKMVAEYEEDAAAEPVNANLVEETDDTIGGEELTDEEAVYETDTLETAETEKPKLSFGSVKEDTSPVNLSGLLHGSVTKQEQREEADSQAETQPSAQSEQASEAVTTEAVTSEEHSNEVAKTEAVTNGQATFEAQLPSDHPAFSEEPVKAGAAASVKIVSHGSVKEDTSPVNLSGLLHGSVTQQAQREEAGVQAEAPSAVQSEPAREAVTTEAVTSEAHTNEEVTSEAHTNEEVTSEAHTNEVAKSEAVTNGQETFEAQLASDHPSFSEESVNAGAAASVKILSKREPVLSVQQDDLTGEQEPEAEQGNDSIWGKWTQVESALKYTLKFRIVQDEETLQEVANNYETPIESLMRANGLTNENIDAGQILLIPGRR